MKHTPGPWKVNNSISQRVENNKGDLIAAVLMATTEGSITPETEANARLIASSPELLEALQKAKLQIEYLHNKFKATGTGILVLSQIEQAINKATGI